MADMYTQFSAILRLNTPEQREWVKKFAPLVTETYGPEVEPLLSALQGVIPEKSWSRLCAALDWEPNPIGIELIDEGMWIYSEEAGSAEVAIIFAHVVMHVFDMDGQFALSWADTCSKLRAEEFMGGVAMATKKGWAYCGLLDQLAHCRNELKRSDVPPDV